jgi:hypothetical protein
MRMGVFAIFIAFLCTACVNFSGDSLNSIADRNLTATEVTESMCFDFFLASQAAMRGPDRAWPVLGKAQQLQHLQANLSKHSIQCYNTVERLNRKVRPLALMHHIAILQSFLQSWESTKALSGSD